MMNLMQRLAAASGSLIVGEQVKSLKAIASEAKELAEHIAGRGRVLVWTESVEELIRAITAATSVQADVFVAHRSISAQHIDDLVRPLGITHLFRSGALEMVNAVDAAGSGFVYVMTSGTTQFPKIAKHTPDTLFGTIKQTAASSSAKWLLTYPATSFAGLQVTFSALIGGGHLVASQQRTMSSFVDAAVTQRVTHISGTPTFWRSFLSLLPSESTALQLQQVTIGGEAVDQSTLDRLRASFPCARITQIYASTEAGVAFSVNDVKAGIPVEWFTGGIGDVQLRVVDDVLHIRSPRMLQRYESGEASPFDAEGWLCTGDLVKEEHGRFIFAGRADGRLNIGGFKVSPEEVESVLLQCRGVADVQVSAAPSPISGQVLVANVVPDNGWSAGELKKSVQRFAYERLEAFKIPRIIRVVERIEAAESGKKVRR
jgi:acyl-coenzyme A synthetase/AMP-(fatty) acid ligase